MWHLPRPSQWGFGCGFRQCIDRLSSTISLSISLTISLATSITKRGRPCGIIGRTPMGQALTLHLLAAKVCKKRKGGCAWSYERSHACALSSYDSCFCGSDACFFSESCLMYALMILVVVVLSIVLWVLSYVCSYGMLLWFLWLRFQVSYGIPCPYEIPVF